MGRPCAGYGPFGPSEPESETATVQRSDITDKGLTDSSGDS